MAAQHYCLFFFGGLWGWAMWYSYTWQTAYQYIFPAWARYANPAIFSILDGLLAIAFWWIARRLKGNWIINFCVLGGLESFPGHLWAIFGPGILNTPLLKTVSAGAALTFGFFEFGFYWGLILLIATFLEWLWGRTRHRPASELNRTDV